MFRIQDIVRVTGLYETLAVAVLNRMENALKAEVPMGQAMRDAYDKAAKVVEEVWQFAKDHPVFVAVVGLGVLVVLAPWAIAALGFGELGPIEGVLCWLLYCMCGQILMPFCSCRQVRCFVAVQVWKICACGLVVLFLPATRNGMEVTVVIDHILPEQNPCEISWCG